MPNPAQKNNTRGSSTISQETTYRFQGFDELYDVAEQLPDVEKTGNIVAFHPDDETSEPVPWRDPVFTDEEQPRLAGEVSSNDDYYNIIQYGDILETVGIGLQQHDDVQPEGHVTVSPTAHKMTGKIGVSQTVEPEPGDEIEMQLHIRSGHSGVHGLKYSVGAERLVCSNGMTAFVEDQVFEQNHSQPFQKGLAFHAVDTVLEGTDVVEQRLQQAQERELMNQDEALLVLQDVGIDRYLENPTTDLINALHQEADEFESPSLYETYNAGTYALTHLADEGVPEYALDNGYEQLSQLLEYGDGIPDPEILGENAVERRYNELLEEPDAEEYWEGEREDLSELAEAHGLTA